MKWTDEAVEAIKTDEAKTLFDAFIGKLEEVDEVSLDFAKTIMKSIQKETGIKGKNLWFPVRAGLTGNVHGPDLDSIMVVLGKQEVLDRINKALNR